MHFGIEGTGKMTFPPRTAQGSTRNCCLPPACWVWMLLGGNAGEHPRAGVENRSQTNFPIFFKIYCNGKRKHRSCSSLSPLSLQERKKRREPLSISCSGIKKGVLSYLISPSSWVEEIKCKPISWSVKVFTQYLFGRQSIGECFRRQRTINQSIIFGLK